MEVWRGRHLGPGSPRPHRACRAAPRRRRPPSSTARRPASRPRKVTSAPRGCAGGPALGEGLGGRRRRPVPGWRGQTAGEAGTPGDGCVGSALGPVAARGAAGIGRAGPRRPRPRLPPPLISAAAPRCSPWPPGRGGGIDRAASAPGPCVVRRSRLLPRRLSSGGYWPRPPRNRFPSASGKVKVLRRRDAAVVAGWRESGTFGIMEVGRREGSTLEGSSPWG